MISPTARFLGDESPCTNQFGSGGHFYDISGIWSCVNKGLFLIVYLFSCWRVLGGSVTDCDIYIYMYIYIS